CAEHNIGHQTPVRPIPIVPAAVVYDLFMGDGRHLPDADLGYAAAVAAAENNDAQGNIGAGAGVSVGKWAGFENAMKSGFGVASFEKDGLVVMATAVTNAVGDVVNKDGTVLAGARSSTGWMADEDPFRQFPARPPVQMTNTTLVVVGTNARLTKIEANRLAQRAHDGMAIAIRPVHTTHDGDTAFALATGQIDAGFDVVANIAVEMVSEAIRNSVRYAKTVGAWPGLAGEA
ncbi:MAG: peptidase S58 family protein, partial [Candidatus Thermofonsia bacterium]